MLQLERERIFRRSWQYVGHVGDVPEPGSFAATCGRRRPGRRSCVTRRTSSARSSTSAVTAARSSARARAARDAAVPLPRVDVRPRRAPDHGAARQQRRAGSRRRSSGSSRCGSRRGDRSSSSTRTRRRSRSTDYLDGIPELVADAGIDLDALRFLQRSESELDCNWKISAENFLECYHCPTAHPGFSAVMDVSPDAYLLEASASRMTQHGPPRAEPRGAYDPTGEIERGQFHLLFPGTVINVMPGRPNFSIGPIVPRGSEQDVPLPRLLRRGGRGRGVDRGVARIRRAGRRRGSRAHRARAGRHARRADRRGPAPSRVREAHRALPGARRRRPRVAGVHRLVIGGSQSRHPPPRSRVR